MLITMLQIERVINEIVRVPEIGTDPIAMEKIVHLTVLIREATVDELMVLYNKYLTSTSSSMSKER